MKTNSQEISNRVMMIPLQDINIEKQVRTKFNQSSIMELAQDIQKRGLLQPIVVREDGKGFILTIGERRLKAMRLIGATHAPAIVANVKSDDLEEIQMIENIQREDLNGKDLMAGVLSLYKQHKSIDAVCALLHKSKSWVSKKVATAMKMGPLTIELMDTGIKDQELLYLFAKLESAYHADALANFEGVKNGTINRNEIRDILHTANKEDDFDLKSKLEASEDNESDQVFTTKITAESIAIEALKEIAEFPSGPARNAAMKALTAIDCLVSQAK